VGCQIPLELEPAARLRPCGAQMRTHLVSADASTDRPVLQDLAARFGAFISKYAVQGIPSLFAC
jgi:hypothetical protein